MSASEALNLSLVERRRTPVVLQSEMMECGLACLSMAMASFGRSVDISILRARYPASMRGVSVARLSDIAEEQGFLLTSYRAKAEQLAELKLPGILHWKDNHYVLLVKYKAGKSVVLHDPAVGARKLSWHEFEKGFSGVAAELEPLPTMKKEQLRNPLSIFTLLQKAHGYASVFTKVVLVALLLEVLLLASPLFLQTVVDEVIPVRDEPMLWSLVAGFAGLALIKGTLKLTHGWLGMALSGLVSVAMKHLTFNHMLKLPLDWFERRGIGIVTARYHSLNDIRTILSENVLLAIVDAAIAVVMLVVLFAYEWRLALVTVAFASVSFVTTLVMYRRYAAAASEEILADAEENHVLVETVAAVGAVKMFGQELRQLAQYSSKMLASTNRMLGMQRVKTWHGSAQFVLGGLGDIAVVAAAAFFVVRGEVSLGMMFGFYAYKQILSDKLSALGTSYFSFRLLGIYTNNIGDVLQSDTEREGSTPLKLSAKPSLTFDDVSFSYEEADEPTLDGFSLVVAPGEIVGVTGPSGGGKSTLVKLLTGALKPSSGSIRLDRAELVGSAPREVRKYLAVVLQSDHLLTGTLLENITMFEPDPDIERARQAACDASVLDTIEAIPTGLQTFILGHAPTFSGGQVQRLLLARAFYKGAPVLVLDEATSALDAEREVEVCDAIRAKGLTTLMVAHRPETLARCDRVVRVGD